MTASVALCRLASAEDKVIGGENRVEIVDEAGQRISILFHSQEAASAAAAGLRGGMSVDRWRMDEELERAASAARTT